MVVGSMTLFRLARSPSITLEATRFVPDAPAIELKYGASSFFLRERELVADRDMDGWMDGWMDIKRYKCA